MAGSRDLRSPAAHLAEAGFALIDRGPVSLRGKAAPVKVYALR